MPEAVIVSTARTPIGKAYRGALNATEGATLFAHAIKAAVARAGLDPAELANQGEAPPPNLDKSSRPKAWKDVWSAGQGVGAAQEILPVETLVAQLEAEYLSARAALAR